MFSDSEDECSGSIQCSESVECRDLPIFKYKEQIIKMVTDNQIVIIQGQTGCGKTTQIPQILLDAGLNKKAMIGITQPRRIATLSMAKRVAYERQCPLGKEVGFQIRFYKKCGASTKIKYMTDGILLNECAQDRNLNDYDIIMIDEAHERSINSDTILALLKIIATRRPELKLLISSATLNASRFSEYFNNAPILAVEGRLYPIETIYMGKCRKYVDKSVETVLNIHRRGEEGDILVFLTGEADIEECCARLENEENLVPLHLYGALDMEEQQKVFKKVEEGKRKVVVATNIAETSLTIPGIRIVIDCGFVKQNNFDSSRWLDILDKIKISKAQAQQRQGRAGREAPGTCYRLYTKAMYEGFVDEHVPEIRRKNLSEISLKIMYLRLDPKELEFMDQPDREEWNRSEIELQDLSLIEENNKLTPLGSQVAILPLDPKLGKVMMTSLSKHCSQDIMKIVSMLTEKFIFIRPRKKIKEAYKKIKEFHDPDGDHFTLLRVYNEWTANLQIIEGKWTNDGRRNKINYTKAKEWCNENFVRYGSMRMVEKVHGQIQSMMKKIGKLEPTTGGRDSIKECIISGYFRNICVIDRYYVFDPDYTYHIRLFDEQFVMIHFNSSLYKDPPELVLAHQCQRSMMCFMFGVLRLDYSILPQFEEEMKIIRYPEILETFPKRESPEYDLSECDMDE